MRLGRSFKVGTEYICINNIFCVLYMYVSYMHVQYTRYVILCMYVSS